MRSETVVFPASICAAMPIFLYFSSLLPLIASYFLPSVMRECAIRFCHTMYIRFLFNRRATALLGFKKLVTQSNAHCFTWTLACRCNQPTHCKRISSIRCNFSRNLIDTTTNTSWPNFNDRSEEHTSE